ncbi:thioredoxin family protein [Metamycoplasma neophronis]|uniref:Thioredoxin n=1 Tax=Metamycoplasma neophronis TaxID=872983 RepID=A0ABY2Z3Y2_9BACT|nr:thioredoxin family protein [Metamycoplasma neophronis]TPR53860.1 thioredoxin family protein [Metamycoplasma neophronis]
MMKKLNNKSDLQDQHLNGKAIVAFRAVWCPPCQMMGPELQRLSENHEDINVFDLDVDQNIDFAREMGVQGIPSLFLYEDGKLVNHVVGYMPAEELVKRFQK